MASTFTSTTLSGSYKDDWAEDDNYHQILFNSGRALQARELTQLQTMIYQEMGRFGRNVFKEGVAVSAGNMDCITDTDFVKVTMTSGTFTDIPVGSVIQQNPENIRARVIAVKQTGSGTVSAPITDNTLYIQYIDGAAQPLSSEPVRFSSGVGKSLSVVGRSETMTVNTLSPTGFSTRFEVDAGEFFVLGRFVYSDPQSLILSPYTATFSGDVGFKVIQEVVTVNDSPALYDNAGDTPNTASPGADRYKITLQLTNKADISADDTFVFLARVENGTIVEEVQESDAYNKIADAMALRTEEESGDYIVNPFTLDFDEIDGDTENLSVTIGAGTAYVSGYRVDNPSPIELIIPRSQAFESVPGEPVSVIYGNYVLLDSARDLPELDLDTVHNMYSDTNATQLLGTTRVRAIDAAGDDIKLYLFDFTFNTSLSLGDSDLGKLRSIKDPAATGKYAIRNETGTDAYLNGATDNDLLMPTARPRLKATSNTVADGGFLSTSQYSQTFTVSTGSFSLDQLGMGMGPLRYSDKEFWLIAKTDGSEAAFAPTVTEAMPSYDATITGLSNVEYRLIYYVQNTETAKKTKTFTTSTAATYAVTNGVVDLGVPDVQQVSLITKGTAAGGIDVSDRFVLDDGQRDNYYDYSRLILKEGETDPGDVWVQYTYWAHSGSGGFYSPESYAGATYADIPEHTTADGTVIDLRNYLDLRPDKSSAGAFTNIMPLPRSGTAFLGKIDYWLPRADKLIATKSGEIQMLLGQQSRDPQLKPTPENSMELYQVLMNANTADADDLQTRAIEHKHYTMADIGKLENKIDDLRTYTELNIAELRAFHTPSLDSAGEERADAGLSLDLGDDQTGSDTENGDYAASIDPENQLIRPKANEDNIRLICEPNYGTVNPTIPGTDPGILKKGDNVYLSYDSDEWKFQSLASRSVNPNPFGRVDNVGVIKLSPSSDEWKDSKEDAVKALRGAGKLDVKQAFLWNNWQWNWKGRNDEDLWQSRGTVGRCGKPTTSRDALNAISPYASERGRTNTLGFVRRVVQNDTLRMRVGRRYIDLALIPWMRSRKVYFKAQGLKPNTKFTPFFDGKDVSAWCKEEAFVQFSDRTDDNGNLFTYNTLTGHPNTATDLISDANGTIEGSFFIPNLKPSYYLTKKGKRRRILQNYLRFRAGIREFKLLDINVNDWAAADSKAFTYYSVFGAMWHKYRNILTTRGMSYAWPLSYGYGLFPNAFNQKELRRAVNEVSAGSVGLYKPQVSGRYGPDTTPISTLSTYNGEMGQVISDYVNVNNRQFAGTAIIPTNLPQNPMAQTFYVDNPFGVVLAKIGLFFQTKDSTLPISIHIRPVINGKPSDNDIVPDSHVFKLPSEINAIGLSPTLSVIQGGETSFVFDEPVFLQPWTHYAVVITTQSSDYKLFSAKTRESVLGSTSRSVSTQPSPGSLFLPQNGIHWFEAKDQDIMMRIARAKFNLGGGTLMLKNADAPNVLLDDNPIRLVNNSTAMYVKAPCNGLQAGDTVQISGATDITDGVETLTASSNINQILTVVKADIQGFQVTLGAQWVGESMNGGGSQVITQQTRIFDTANPTVEQIIPEGTSVDMSARFISGIHASGDVANRFQPGTGWLTSNFERLTADQNINFDSPRAIYHAGITEGNSGIGGSEAGKNASAYVKLDLKTTSDYVSPIIDLQRASLTLVEQCIDDPDQASANQTISVWSTDETEPSGGSTGSKHITTPVTLEVPAVGIDVQADLSLPPGSGVDFYYRTAVAGEDITLTNWIYKPPVSSVANTAAGQFTRANYLPGGQGGSLKEFTQVQTKYVMKGTIEAPAIKSLNIKYLAT
jgi:hypothetical protein